MTGVPDWSADPVIRDQIIAGKARRELVRTTLIWGPPFVLLLGAGLFFLVDLITGPNFSSTGFLVGLLLFFALLTGFMSISALRDLTGGPRETEGTITRHWSRRDSLVLKTGYIRVDDQILRVDGSIHGSLERGDYVSVEFYPHSQLAVRIEKRPDPNADDEAEAELAL